MTSLDPGRTSWRAPREVSAWWVATLAIAAFVVTLVVTALALG